MNTHNNIMNILDLNKGVKPSVNNILKDNDLVKGTIEIARMKTYDECQRFSRECVSDICLLDNLKQNDTIRWVESLKRQKIIKSFSKEAYDTIMQYSLEEDNKNVFIKMLNFFKEIFKKGILYLEAFIKSIQLKYKEIMSRLNYGLYKNFDPAKFTKVDTEVNVTPLKYIDSIEDKSKKASNFIDEMISGGIFTYEKSQKVINDIEKAIGESKSKKDWKILYNALEKIKEYDEQLDSEKKVELNFEKFEELKKEINITIFGSSDIPKKRHIKISEYLKCTAKKRPKALECLSKNFLDKLRENSNKNKELSKILTTSIKQIEKLIKSGVDDKEVKQKMVKEVSKIFNNVKNSSFKCMYLSNYTANLTFNIIFDIAKAIKQGLE